MRGLSLICGLVLGAAVPLGSAAEAIPTGKLPADATPLGYTLKFKVDPREAKFSAHVGIRVKLAKATDHVWLHALDLYFTSGAVTDASGKIHKATFAQRDPECVSEVTFDAALP